MPRRLNCLLQPKLSECGARSLTLVRPHLFSMVSALNHVEAGRRRKIGVSVGLLAIFQIGLSSASISATASWLALDRSREIRDGAGIVLQLPIEVATILQKARIIRINVQSRGVIRNPGVEFLKVPVNRGPGRMQFCKIRPPQECLCDLSRCLIVSPGIDQTPYFLNLFGGPNSVNLCFITYGSLVLAQGVLRLNSQNVQLLIFRITADQRVQILNGERCVPGLVQQPGPRQ